MSKPFAIADVPTGVLNALVKKIMRQTGKADAGEAIRLITSGEWLVKKPRREWREEDGIIYLEVTSAEIAGDVRWLRWCEERAIGLHGSATDILISPESAPIPNVTYKVAIVTHSTAATLEQVRGIAKHRQWREPPVQLACLIREKFSDWEITAMGIRWINVMHKPVTTIGIPTILSVCSMGDYENFIWVQPEPKDSEPTITDIGYAYVVSEIHL